MQTSSFSSPNIDARPASWVWMTGFAVAILWSGVCRGQDEDNDWKQVTGQQQQLAEQYQLLERKLYSLYEFEKEKNPGRAQLLQRAFQESQQKMTSEQLTAIVRLMDDAQLKQAEGEQQQVVKQLQQLLQLLQTDEQGQLLADQRKRFQQYRRDVDRLLRIQKAIRARAENDVDPQQLAPSEGNASKQAGNLADQIQRNEGQDSDSSSKDDDNQPTDPKPSSDDNDAGSDDAQTPSPEAENSEESKPDDPADGTEPSAESSDSDGESSQSPGQPADGQGQSGQSGQSGQENQQPTPAQQVQQRVQAAREKMKQAQQDLEQAKRDEAIDRMQEAELALEEAKRELEEILRQLREEEVGQVLAMLEERFRRMLDLQVRVNESTIQLDRTPSQQRGTEFEIESGKLSQQQREIATQAGRALLLLQEDGSSVAFPVTVEELQQDMLQVADRLQAVRINAMTLEIEADIVESLNDIIQALVQTQEDLEKTKQQSGKPGAGGKPGEQPLVDKLAEIKMLRGLQQRIYRRHQRYAKFLDDPNDPIGFTADPELASALKRLADRQAQLTEITEDLVAELNQ